MLQEILDAIKAIKFNKMVTCPLTYPLTLNGSDAATALESGDTLGFVTELRVPTSGIIYGATLYDFDDKGIATDLEIFTAPIANVAVDAAFAPTDAEMLNFLTELNFVAFDDQGGSQTSEIFNVGKGYSTPTGVLYLQGVTRGTPTVTAGSPYRVRLYIISDDPNWKEY